MVGHEGIVEVAGDERACRSGVALLGLAVVLFGAACAGGEPARFSYEVVVSARASREVVTDLGYRVQLSSARSVIEDVLFTTRGETHAGGFWRSLAGAFVGRARAHPGHSAGGEVLGELPGIHRVDWLAGGAVLGTATLVEGRYDGVDFAFADDTERSFLGSGLAMELSGVARRGEDVVAFTIALDLASPGLVVGVPIVEDTGEGRGALARSFVADGKAGVRLALGLSLVDPLADPPIGAPAGSEVDVAVEGRAPTFFDGVDFVALAAGGEVLIEGGGSAHNRMRRAALSHEFYVLEVE